MCVFYKSINLWRLSTADSKFFTLPKFDRKTQLPFYFLIAKENDSGRGGKLGGSFDVNHLLIISLPAYALCILFFPQSALVQINYLHQCGTGWLHLDMVWGAYVIFTFGVGLISTLMHFPQKIFCLQILGQRPVASAVKGKEYFIFRF